MTCPGSDSVEITHDFPTNFRDLVYIWLYLTVTALGSVQMQACRKKGDEKLESSNDDLWNCLLKNSGIANTPANQTIFKDICCAIAQDDQNAFSQVRDTFIELPSRIKVTWPGGTQHPAFAELNSIFIGASQSKAARAWER